jgi:hypothetical protein
MRSGASLNVIVDNVRKRSKFKPKLRKNYLMIKRNQKKKSKANVEVVLNISKLIQKAAYVRSVEKTNNSKD